MKKGALLGLLGLMLAFTACSPFQIRSDYDETVSFGQYRTYQIRQDNLNLNDLDKGRVIHAIQQEMANRGYQVSNHPDLIVNLKATHKQIRDIQTTNPWGYGWGWGWGPYWGPGFGYSQTFSDTYNKGALTMDFVDTRTGKLVWQGIGQGLSVDSPKSKVKQIPEMVNQMMANYPPQGTIGIRQ